MRGVEKRKRLEWLDGRFGVTVRSTCTTRLALMPGWLQVEKDWVRFAVHVVSFLLADGTFFFFFSVPSFCSHVFLSHYLIGTGFCHYGGCV